MTSTIKSTKKLVIYSFGIGAIYLIFGLLEFARGLSESLSIPWKISTVLVSPDMFSGVTLVIVGLIFLFEVHAQWKSGKDEGSFLAVGTLLAAVFFAVYLAIMGAHAIGAGVYMVSPEAYAEIFVDWAEWTWTTDMRPGLWLFVFTLPGAYYTMKMWLSRKKKT